MAAYEGHVLSADATTAIRTTFRVRSSRQQVSRDVHTQRLTRLHVTVDLDVDGMVQQCEPAMFFVDVGAAIEEFTKQRKVAHLDSPMSRAQVVHRQITQLPEADSIFLPSPAAGGSR
ncbi:hypothetical protein AMK34_35435 [Amycolatopsis sp. CB00013]|nr:hypothetical protein AMK34_35435 [Amycolatopsis sp. CB00013]